MTTYLMTIAPRILIAAATVLSLTACDKPAPATPPKPTAEVQAPAVASPSPLQAWAGKWIGPEGTWLQLAAKADNHYDVVVRNLDGEHSFDGIGSDDHITFVRDGVKENIRATDGVGTGMKWLAEKTSCLTIKAGEGFCR